MSVPHTVAIIDSLFENACVELFQSFGCTVYSATASPDDLEGSPVAHIDAGSDDVEVTIVLRVPHAVLSLSYPEADNILSVDDAKLEDWISELSNQLVGRLKNKLLTYDCRVKIGLPTAYFDADDEVLADGQYCATYHFSIDNELLECSIYTDLHNPDLTLVDPGVTDEAAEGELELF